MTTGDRRDESNLQLARQVLEIEGNAVHPLRSRVDHKFLKAVELLETCRGRVITTGIGKSGIIAKKIAATFSSTGTAAYFVHPSEGVHGDVGVIQSEDVVVGLSHSGETPELLRLLERIRRLGSTLIALTGVPNSSLAETADITLDCSVESEACPLNLAPTASTTATLALGDALAMVLLTRKGFREEDFAILRYDRWAIRPPLRPQTGRNIGRTHHGWRPPASFAGRPRFYQHHRDSAHDVRASNS